MPELTLCPSSPTYGSTTFQCIHPPHPDAPTSHHYYSTEEIAHLTSLGRF